MVKILHFADLHLGVESYGRPDPVTGLQTRLLDFLRSLDELIEVGLEQSVDMVVFAGDAYKSRDPNPTHQREFARRIQRLASADIPVVLVPGNHDLPGTPGRADTLDIFATLQVPNVYVAATLSTLRILTRSGPVQVIALPWITRSRLRSPMESATQTQAELEQVSLARLHAELQREYEGLDRTQPTILVAHASVQGALYGSERSVALGHDLVVPQDILVHDAIDYVALGHIHRHQVLRTADPPIVYAGSVDRIDFGEERESKGFVIAEVSRGSAKYEFHTISTTRRFVTIEVKATSQDPMKQVEEAIAHEQIDGAVVRVVIHTTQDKSHLLIDHEIYRMLGSAFKVSAIIRDIQRTQRSRLPANCAVEQLSPQQLLEHYLRLHQTPETRIKALLARAESLMINTES